MDGSLKSPGLYALEEAFHRQVELSPRSEPAPTLEGRLDRLRAAVTENEARFEERSGEAIHAFGLRRDGFPRSQ
jgi:coniferyl-aldehyde dehydrogenase